MLFPEYGVEFTGIKTGAALDAKILVDLVGFFPGPPDGVGRTDFFTQPAAGAVFLDAGISQKILAHQRRAFFVFNVHCIFVPEVPDGGQHRVWSGHAETAQGCGPDDDCPGPPEALCLHFAHGHW